MMPTSNVTVSCHKYLSKSETHLLGRNQLDTSSILVQPKSLAMPLSFVIIPSYEIDQRKLVSGGLQ